MPFSLSRAAPALALALGLALAVALGPAPAATPRAGTAETPSCGEGPERVGNVLLGTPCDDRIVVPATVALVYGGAGDDVIIGANSGVTTAASGDPGSGLHLEVGSQTFIGGDGDDVVFGDRGNDTLRGGAGNDRLHGGIGDDALLGGDGDDLLAGGFGADEVDGEAGDDHVRGDPTIDHIFDSGGGTDTLSFATGATPGFTAAANPTGAANFPGPEGERGVWLKLDQGGTNALNGAPALGGGNDEIQPGAFERVIGTPFADYIVGSAAAEEIWGGGGADVIRGGGGADALHGGAGGDLLEAAAGAAIDGESGTDNCLGAAIEVSCEGDASAVTPRDAGRVSIGLTGAGTGLTQVYAVGSAGADAIAVSEAPGGAVITIGGGPFDPELGGCVPLDPLTAFCPISGRLDAVLLAGLGGDDTLNANLADGVGVFLLGGEGFDQLGGGAGEDVLVDGPGPSPDVLAAQGGDDALTHNGGADLLDGGPGSDLFLSVSICDGEVIDGGAERVGAPTPDRDNASWARLEGVGVAARIDLGRVGAVAGGEEPVCPGGGFDALARIEDLEASNQSDVLFGDAGSNQLLGHRGEDSYFALDGDDSILANSGSRDRVIDCGPGGDQAVIDLAAVGDPAPRECERVREGAAGDFRPPPLGQPAPPGPAPPAPAATKPRDRTPPRTRLLRRPPRLVRVAPGKRRLVSFRFGADERASFRCRLDRAPYRPCASPRRYRVRPGRHVFRLFAVDAAGNRDRTPATFAFRVARKRQGPGPTR